MRIFTALAVAALVAVGPAALLAQDEGDEQQSLSDDQAEQAPFDESEQQPSDQAEQQAPDEAWDQAGYDQAGQPGESSNTEDQAAADFDSAAASAPASAQTGLRAGATVTDPQGRELGTIIAVEGANVVLRTDRREVRLPVDSFTATGSEVRFGMTRDQLNSGFDRMQAQLEAGFAIGTTVRDRRGAMVGAISAVDAEWVTVRIDGRVVRLLRDTLSPSPDGLVADHMLAELLAYAEPAKAPTE